LLDQGANWIHDNIGKGVPDAFSKVTGLSAPTHASPSTGAAGETTGTTHSALTADNDGQSGDAGMPHGHVTDPASSAGSGIFSTLHADGAGGNVFTDNLERVVDAVIGQAGDVTPGHVGDGTGGNIFTDHLQHVVDAVIGQAADATPGHLGDTAAGNIFTDNLQRVVDTAIGQAGDATPGPATTDNAQGMGSLSTTHADFWDQATQAVNHVTTAGFPLAADAAPLTSPQIGELTHLGNLGDVASSATHDPVVMQAPDSGIHISASDIHPDLQDHGMASAAAAVNPQPLPAADVLIDYGAVAASPHYDYHLG